MRYHLTIGSKRHAISAGAFWSLFLTGMLIIATVFVAVSYCLVNAFGWLGFLATMIVGGSISINGATYALIMNDNARRIISGIAVISAAVVTILEYVNA